MDKVLITGANGFIGHYLVDEFIKDHEVICLLRPNTKNLSRLDPYIDRIKIVYHDIQEPLLGKIKDFSDVKLILHAAGNPGSIESLMNPLSAIKDNVIGTTNLLDLARNLSLKRFFYYSAGEVFGPVDVNTDSLETDHYNSVSPYAASKASGEEICIAYSKTFGVPISITHITNTFGPRSQSNRFPVIAIKRILEDIELVIHRGPDGSISGRRWFHAQDVANHTRLILDTQKTICEKWNSSGLEYYSNLDFAKLIALSLNKELKYRFEENVRTGNEPRYSPSPLKLVRHGWYEPLNMFQRIQETVQWYQQNPEWLTC
jgi:dTDP-glucose 4,6-dehydratase